MYYFKLIKKITLKLVPKNKRALRLMKSQEKMSGINNGKSKIDLVIDLLQNKYF